MRVIKDGYGMPVDLTGVKVRAAWSAIDVCEKCGPLWDKWIGNPVELPVTVLCAYRGEIEVDLLDLDMGVYQIELRYPDGRIVTA